MVGNPSYMRVPEIIGVEIVGDRAPGITATDIALSMTSFLRENSFRSNCKLCRKIIHNDFSSYTTYN